MSGRLDEDRIAQARGITTAEAISLYPHKLKRQGHEIIGPCPRCGGVDRFAINLAKGLWLCRGCGGKGGDGISLVQWLDQCDFPTAIERLVGAAPPRDHDPLKTESKKSKDDAEQIRKARFLWSQRRPIIGSPAERYLREARNYKGPIPATLGFLPPYQSDHHPAMIAAFGKAQEPEPGVLSIADATIKSVHLTLLKPDGSDKAAVAKAKLMVGPVAGSLIVLAPMNDLLGLAITEGIEDALSIHAATGLGAWAAGSAPVMRHLAAVVPDYADAVTILADDNEAGRNGARELAAGLRARGIHVEPIIIGRHG